MKKLIILILVTNVLSFSLFSQIWVQKQEMPGDERHNAVSFSVFEKGNVALGYNGSNRLDDFWEYNPANNSWTQKSDFTGLARSAGISFTTDSVAIIGAGWNGIQGYFDIYAYNPISDVWTPKASYPGAAARNCLATSVQGKGYVGGGDALTPPYKEDFWEYDPSSDSWVQKSNFPFGPRVAGIAFGIDDIAYFGLGHDGSVDYNDLWAYNPSTDQWNQMKSFPGFERLQASCFVVNGKAIVGGGSRLGSGSIKLSDYYEYNPKTNDWKPVFSFANGARGNSRGFAVSKSGYICTGVSENGAEMNDLWEYTPSTVSVNDQNNSVKVTVYPVPNNGILNLQYDTKGSDATFKLFNSFGQLILIKGADGTVNHMKIDLHQLAEGNYYYHFIHNNGIVSGKIPVIK